MDKFSCTYFQGESCCTIKRKGTFAALASAVSNPLGLMELWDYRLQKRRYLMNLPDYLLEDMGLTREQVVAEHKTPFWKEGIY